MRWLKYLGIALGALLLIVVAASWWLLDTSAGLRFVLARAQAATHGALHIDQADGSVLGPLRLQGLSYRTEDGLDVAVASISTDVRLWPLLSKNLHINYLNIEDVAVTLPANPAPSSNEPATSFSWQPPVNIVLNQAHIGTLKIRQDGAPIFASNSIDLAGRWTQDGVELTQLALRANDGYADISGQLGTGQQYRGDSKAEFAWTLGDITYAGSLSANSDGSLAHATLDLSKPLPAHLQLQWQQNDAMAWTAHLRVDEFNPAPLLGDSAIHKLAANLQGSGDRHGGKLQGSINLNQYVLALQPLRAHFSDDWQRLTLDELVLTSAQIKGQLQANGIVQLDAQPISAKLGIHWQNVELPADLVGQTLASHGNLDVSGSAQQFHAQGKLAIGPPGELADFTLNMDGTAQTIALHTLKLAQAQGGMQAHGSITLQPALAWDIKASANDFDPGQLFAGWNGRVDFDLASSGEATAAGLAAGVDLRKLGGKLRQHSLDGGGTVHLSPQGIVDGNIQLRSGASTVKIKAQPGSSNRIQVDVHVASLGDWLPDASGTLEGQLQLRGQLPKLSVKGHIKGNALTWQSHSAQALALHVNIPDISKPSGKLALAASGVHSSGLSMQSIKLDASGSQVNHHLTLDASGPQVTLALALDGSMHDKAWHGTLTTLNLTAQGLPAWQLQKPAQLVWDQGAGSLSPLCLSAGEPSLCVSATHTKNGQLDASYQLHAFPLGLLLAASASTAPVRVDGSLEGHGNIQRLASGQLSGKAQISSQHGSITYLDRPGEPLLVYQDFIASADLTGNAEHLKLSATLNDNGQLDGQLTIHGAEQTLDGALNLNLPNLHFVSLLTTELAAVKGRLKGHFEFAGNVAKPIISGQASIDGFTAEVPVAGITLSAGKLTLATSASNQWQIDASVHSGKGQINITGFAGLDASQATSITVKGDAFTVADIPAAKVVMSPDLAILRDDQGLHITGTVAIDRAQVDLSKLPGAGASQASPDIVIVDDEQKQQAAALPVYAKVKIDLGEHTKVQGLGLDGRIGGELTVIERPGHETLGQGQLTVNGTYRAYGQDLHIEKGQLLFASTPIDNPALSIRATRELNPNATIDTGNKVGLDISGTAQHPVLTVFSNPVMQQSDALSYLVTGKPLSQVKGGEGNMVGAAAQALGSAAGDLLAKSVGSKIGADVGVSSNEALGGGAALTIGKYLSPRLYLSYGVGLFDPGEVVTLRYILSKRWNFEALNATTFNRMMFNYRLER